MIVDLFEVSLKDKIPMRCSIGHKTFSQPRTFQQHCSQSARGGRVALFFSFLAILFSPPAFAEIFLTVESPAPNQKVSGIAPLSGWAFSTTGAHVTVTVQVDSEDSTE